MDVLVVGSGGREDALVQKLAESDKVETIHALPGNDGMAGQAHLIEGNAEDVEAVARAAREADIDLAVIGPEKPLALGVVDALQEVGVAAFGPSREAARIESSKVFAKQLMEKYDIPTADFRVFSSHSEAVAHLNDRSFPAVIKADGLAAGKGVVVARDRAEGLRALTQIMVDRRFGDAGERVIIEDCLVGEELSVMAITDGETVVPLDAAQDHKAIYDGDRGPNTGGMGAFCPVQFYDEELAETVCRDILRPTVRAMAEEGVPFQGVLYAGLMVTEDGPEVLEFNCRFGDPEAQVVLPRLDSDLAPVLAAAAAADGSLASEAELVHWREQSAVCVVLASEGYPLDYEKGYSIEGLDEVAENVRLYHAGTVRTDAGWRTVGGRVLGVTGLGRDLEQARRRAYRQIESIRFSGMHYRTDIGR